MNAKRRRHEVMQAHQSAAGGRFSKGADPRRHVLSSEERSRGGKTRWEQILAQMRAHQGELFPHEGCWGKWMRKLRNRKR